MLDLRPLTFRDIMESDLFFYDHELKSECSKFCQQLNIDYLPTVSSKEEYYRHHNGSFIGPLEIDEKQKVNSSELIFEEKVLLKFSDAKHNVLFVYEKSLLIGVVHIADYNKSIVLLNYYGYLLDFEQGLRELLILNEVNPEAVIDFYRIRGRIDPYYEELYRKCKEEKFIKKLKRNNPFQSFTLPGLLRFTHEKKILHIKEDDIKFLRDLRNSVMHGQDSVSFEEDLFSHESLTAHFKRIQVFTKCHNEIKKKIKMKLRANQKIKNSLKLKTLEEFSPSRMGSNQLMWKYLEKNR